MASIGSRSAFHCYVLCVMMSVKGKGRYCETQSFVVKLYEIV